MKSIEGAAQVKAVLTDPSKKNTPQIVELLTNNTQNLIDFWVHAIRDEFNEPQSTSDQILANHIHFVLDVLIQELRNFANEQHGAEPRGTMVYNQGHIVDEKEAGDDHGKQRARINAYNVDKVFREYVLLKKIIIDFLQQHDLLDIDHLQLITCVIESCSRDSLSTFTQSLQKVQRKLLGSLIHDLRNPLNVVSVIGSVLSMDDSNASYGGKLERASRRMAVMLEDMLQMVSIEAGQGLELAFKAEDLQNYFKVLVDDTYALYGKRFKAVIPDGKLAGVFDVFAVIRIVENLISNAFKYGSSDTPVTLTVTQDESDILVDVHNFGKPIPQQKWETIFGFLKRYEGHEPTREKSWGIGLAIAKSAAQGHKGSITLTSNETDGTNFTLKLPKHAYKEGNYITVVM